MADIEIDGNKLDAEIYFLNDRLSQVTLTHSGQPTLENFEAFIILLRARYGPELNLKMPDDDALLAMAEAEWMLPTGANVSLVYIDGVTLNINYQARLIREAMKL